MLTFDLSVINLSFTKKVGGVSPKVCSLCSREQIEFRFKRTLEQKSVQGTKKMFVVKEPTSALDP